MLVATHDLGLGNSKSMLVEWSEMMGWILFGIL
jgi:hypothetical protein